MKKIMILMLMLLATGLSFTQAQTGNMMDGIRRVATRGYAEREVTPDIVYLSISLKEYFVNGNVKEKVDMETLEKQLFDAAMAIGVKKEDFTVQNIYSYNYESGNESKKKENKQLLQAKQFRIKVSNLNGLHQLLDGVDPKGMSSTSISGYDHSQKRAIEKELKVAAVQDARANAEILASAAGDTVGKALAINDNSSFNWNDMMPAPRMYAMAKMASADVATESTQAQSLDISVRPIKLTCNIDGVFELK